MKKFQLPTIALTTLLTVGLAVGSASANTITLMPIEGSPGGCKAVITDDAGNLLMTAETGEPCASFDLDPSGFTAYDTVITPDGYVVNFTPGAVVGVTPGASASVTAYLEARARAAEQEAVNAYLRAVAAEQEAVNAYLRALAGQ